MPALAIFNATPVEYGGGFLQFVSQLCVHAENRGWSARIITPPATQFLRIVRLLGLGRRFSHLQALDAPKEFDLLYLRKADYIYVKNEPLDILWLNQLRAPGKRTIGFHTPLQYPASRLSFRARNLIYRSPFYARLLAGAKLHVLNEAESALLPSAALRTQARVIPNGVRIVPGMRCENANPKLLFVGRLTAQKGLDRLSPFAPKLSAGALTVIGDGELRQSLQSAFGDRAIFEGTVSHNRVVEALQSHEFLIMPSRWEGMPLIMLEAMSVGCIPLVSDIPQLRLMLPLELQWLSIDFETEFEEAWSRLVRMVSDRGALDKVRATIVGHVHDHYDSGQQYNALLDYIVV